MKESKFVLVGFVFVIFATFFGITEAQELSMEEAIVSFDGVIEVNIDNSVDVTEKIIYNSGPNSRHGIYRDIYLFSAQERKMTIGNISVTGKNGETYPYEISNEGKNERLKIGDPDKTFLGEKMYVIRYTASDAVSQLKDIDEIYWNVTGNEWLIPIYKATGEIILPKGNKALQTSCYYGKKGETNGCENVVGNAERYVFNSPNTLQKGEGLTIAAGFSKGIVSPYTAVDDTKNFFQKYIGWILGIALPILSFVISFWYWRKKGRDPKGRGVIIPEYDVPEKLTPMEVVGIMDENIGGKDISSEIIYLATLGYLKISEKEEKVLGLFKKKDYELIKTKDYSDLPNDFDRILLDKIFEGGKNNVKLSDLKNNFYREIPKITKPATVGLLEKGYYKNLGRMRGGYGFIFIGVFLSIWLSSFVVGITHTLLSGGNAVPIILGIVLSLIIISIVYYLSPAKTDKGVYIKEYLLGLKDYLRIAEKDRLEFHNAPEKKPETFEKLLPFAMAMGVAEIWAKEFEDIYKNPPTWYESSYLGSFSAMHFNDSLSGFTTATAASFSSGASGSGGGGFSGGGGGGGGGGGW